MTLLKEWMGLMIDEMGLYGFFNKYYEGTNTEDDSRKIDEEESKFLVRIMDKNSQGYVTYEEYFQF